MSEAKQAIQELMGRARKAQENRKWIYSRSSRHISDSYSVGYCK